MKILLDIFIHTSPAANILIIHSQLWRRDISYIYHSKNLLLPETHKATLLVDFNFWLLENSIAYQCSFLVVAEYSVYHILEAPSI